MPGPGDRTDAELVLPVIRSRRRLFLLAAAVIATRMAGKRVGDPSVSINGRKNPRDLEPMSPGPVTP
jgi:hypothetical protein